MKSLCTLLIAAAVVTSSLAQPAKQEVIQQLESRRTAYEAIALKIWDYAEVGYHETKSSNLLQAELRNAGFAIEAGVAGMPTAFVASYGSGHPIIGILAEYDALPGLSQEAIPERKERPGVAAGHACGHHLFGTASTAAAIAVKDWLMSSGHTGTIRLYGCPAEEGGSGKVYLVRDGRFSDVDAVLHWHASDRNSVRLSSSLANISGKFRFHGIASHAAASPERGRSALKAVEAMDFMVNGMREHVPDSTRIHYVITHGGEAPNVVPAFAEVYYYVRSPSRDTVRDVWERVSKAAQGAALGTGTTVDWEITGGVYELLPNETLARVMQPNLELVGGVTYTAEEKIFAEKIGHTLFGKPPAPETAGLIAPWDGHPLGSGGGSTDVADISWVVPTMGLNTATWVPGTPAHSWQAAAAGGTGIGLKGMMVAAKTITLTVIDLYHQPESLAKAKAELEQRRGADFKYAPMLGNRPPALNYRD